MVKSWNKVSKLCLHLCLFYACLNNAKHAATELQSKQSREQKPLALRTTAMSSYGLLKCWAGLWQGKSKVFSSLPNLGCSLHLPITGWKQGEGITAQDFSLPAIIPPPGHRIASLAHLYSESSEALAPRAVEQMALAGVRKIQLVWKGTSTSLMIYI